MTTFNTFWIYLTPLLGAYVADQYLGRFKAIQGMFFLVGCAPPPAYARDGFSRKRNRLARSHLARHLRHPRCHQQRVGAREQSSVLERILTNFPCRGIIGLFCVAIVIMGLGTGCFKANVAPLIAEQVTRQKAVVEVRRGKKVL